MKLQESPTQNVVPAAPPSAGARFAALLVVPLALAVALTGCSQNSDQMCTKLEALDAKSGKKDKDDKTDPKEKHAKCVKDFDRIKEVSPDGYKKIGSCVSMSDADQAGACLLVVMLGDDKLAADAEKQSKEKAEEDKKKRAEKLAAWADAKTKSIDLTFKTFDDKKVSVTAEVPATFEVEADSKTDMGATWKGPEDKTELFSNPPSCRFSAGFGAPDLDAELKIAEMLKQTFVKKDKTADGYVIAMTGDIGLSVKMSKKNDDSSIECDCHIYGEDAQAVKDKLLPWMEKTCASMKVK